jgi:hypothetical protein
MSASHGIFSLRSPTDLLRKLRQDMARIEANPIDAFAAFDFFVTAHHCPEWFRKAGRSTRRLSSTRRVRTVFKVVGEIANGGKYFLPRRTAESAIARTSLREGTFDPETFDPATFDVGELLIELTGAASSELGETIEAQALAREVLAILEGAVDESP